MGIRWEKSEDVAEIGRCIATYDKPRVQNFLKVRAELVNRMKGRSYGHAVDMSPTNDVLEFVANLEPDLAFNLPEAEVFTDKGGMAYEAARGLHYAFNQLLKEIHYERELRKSATDYCFGYAVRARGLGPRPGYEDDGVEWPWSASVPVDRFGWDTRTQCFEDAEYAFQEERIFHHDLLAKAREDNESLVEGEPGWWDLKAIQRMADDTDKDGKVCYYTVYLPNADPKKLLPDNEKHPERYHGVQIYLDATHGAQPASLEIRKATPHYGPNPYTVIGMQRIPDESMPMSVMVLTVDQGKRYNDLVESNNEDAIAYKNMFITQSQKLARMVKNGKHRHVFYDAAFSPDKYAVLPVGGVSDQGLLQEERAERLYHRAIGLTDMERGALTQDVTATQTAVTAGASTKRRDGQINTWQAGIEEDLYGLLWLLYYTDTVIVDSGPEAADEGHSLAPVFFGGDFDKKQVLDYYRKHYPDIPLKSEDLKAGPDVPLADLQLRVRLGSMGRKSKPERLLDTQYEATLVDMVMSQLIKYPPLDAKKYARHIAKRSGFSELPDFIDYAWVDFMRSLAVQSQVPPAQGEEPAGTLKSGPRTLEMPTPQADRLMPQNAATSGKNSSTQAIRGGRAEGAYA